MYVVEVLIGHPKDKHRQLKHHITFYIQQQAMGNTCNFHVCLNMVVFGAQLNYVVSVSVFILLYY
jgi:type II secretory pathway component PulL